jgi:hypothetical protein
MIVTNLHRTNHFPLYIEHNIDSDFVGRPRFLYNYQILMIR